MCVSIVFSAAAERTYDLAFSAVVFFQHLDVRVLRKAVLADGRKVRGLPS
jgi:hypothetical protein